MRRSGPLKRKTPLSQKTPLRRSSAPLSDEKRTKWFGPRYKKKAVSAAEKRAQEAFKAAIKGLRCVVCNKTEREAYKETGYGHEAHHGIRQQVLRRLGIDPWDVRLAVCTCEEPCHRRHTSRKKRIRRDQLPPAFLEFVREHQLDVEFSHEYPS